MTVGMDLPRQIETVIVGAGQAGLSLSALLRRTGREHVLLERRDRIGGGWLDRWDSFCLVSPNWTASFPDFEYDAPDRDAFMARDRIAGRIADYAAAIDAPVVLGTRVERLAAGEGGARFRLATPHGPVDADRVIVATGGFHDPRVPRAADQLSKRVQSVHAHEFRNEAALPPGGVLIVGSGQTGVQLAEELHDAGRRVVLSTGRCGRAPRRYRGEDVFVWLWRVRNLGGQYGIALPLLHQLPDPRLRYACNPHLSGHDGGHDTNLRRFAAEGMTLVGRFQGFDGERATFTDDLASNLAFADAWFGQRWQPLFDRYIDAAGLNASADDRAPFEFEPPAITELDLAAESISTVLWTTGYRLDYAWIDLPAFDADGIPRQVDGVSEVDGLSFIGLPWLRDQGSATLYGVRRDAERLLQRLERAPPAD